VAQCRAEGAHGVTEPLHRLGARSRPFRQGTITLKGNEALRPGSYLITDRGGFEASHYAYEMTHQFVVGGSFITMAAYDRGTGFIERLKRGAPNSAYMAEMTIGGAYG